MRKWRMTFEHKRFHVPGSCYLHCIEGFRFDTTMLLTALIRRQFNTPVSIFSAQLSSTLFYVNHATTLFAVVRLHWRSVKRLRHEVNFKVSTWWQKLTDVFFLQAASRYQTNRPVSRTLFTDVSTVDGKRTFTAAFRCQWRFQHMTDSVTMLCSTVMH